MGRPVSVCFISCHISNEHSVSLYRSIRSICIDSVSDSDSDDTALVVT